MFALVVLDYAFEDDDVEGHVLAVDWQQDGVCLVVNVDQVFLKVLRQLFLLLVAFDLVAFDSFLLLEVATEVLVASFLEFLQFLFLKNRLMLVSLFLVLESLVGCF